MRIYEICKNNLDRSHFNVLFAGAFSPAGLVNLTINEIVPGPDDILLSVTGTYADGSKRSVTEGLVWYSSNRDIVAVSPYGNLHFTGEAGYVTITVYKGAISGRRSLHVEPWPVKIEIETKLLPSENPYRLMLKAKPATGRPVIGTEDNVQWSTTDPWAAWVNNRGIVTFTGRRICHHQGCSR